MTEEDIGLSIGGSRHHSCKAVFHPLGHDRFLGAVKSSLGTPLSPCCERPKYASALVGRQALRGAVPDSLESTINPDLRRSQQGQPKGQALGQRIRLVRAATGS